MSLANYLEAALLDHVSGVAAYTQPASLWVQLHIGDPGEDGDANPAVENTRLQVTFTAAVSGDPTTATAGDVPLEWADLPATETFTDFSVWDDETAGNALGYGPLTEGGSPSPAAMNAGDTLRLTELDWTLD